MENVKKNKIRVINIKTIGLGSKSRVGKDTLAKCLFTLLNKDGYSTRIYSLAYFLKQSCEKFLEDNFGYNVWSDKTEEKACFRDFLVLVGKMHREQSQGTFFTKIIQEKIKKDAELSDSNIFVPIITDIRYADSKYSQDEHAWLKETMKGILVDINRTVPHPTGGALIAPANTDEAIYSPILHELSDYKFTWESLSDNFGPIDFSNTYNGAIYREVLPLYQKIKEEFIKITT